MIRRLELKKEIAFSPSTQGSLKVAQYTGIGEYPKAWLLSEEKDYGLPSEQIKKHNEKEIEKWNKVGMKATQLVKEMMKKMKGKKIGIGNIIESERREKEAIEAKEKAEKEKKELEALLAAMRKERDGLKKQIEQQKAKEEEER